MADTRRSSGGAAVRRSLKPPPQVLCYGSALRRQLAVCAPVDERSLAR